MAILRRVVLNGFKSIKSLDLELGPLNVLIGENGAGKSNLISFFEMLKEMMSNRLESFVTMSDHAHSILHYGPKATPQLKGRLEFSQDSELRTYDFRLAYTAGDALVFADERVSLQNAGSSEAQITSFGAGHQEARIVHGAEQGIDIAIFISELINSCWFVFRFDTSAHAVIRQYTYLGNDRQLASDGHNLAAFLYRLQKQDHGSAYKRIVSTIRLIAPFFHDFDLAPSGTHDLDIILNWRDKESNQIFGPHQLSDGTLRAMCLVTLLMQPRLELPNLIIVDEPELGLHPYALNIIASLFKQVSHHAQVLISTQSSSFLDSFDPEDVIVVDRKGRESVFVRPDPAALESWLEEYSLGGVWEKNVIGGGPH
jgi:predicted ATPase